MRAAHALGTLRFANALMLIAFLGSPLMLVVETVMQSVAVGQTVVPLDSRIQYEKNSFLLE